MPHHEIIARLTADLAALGTAEAAAGASILEERRGENAATVISSLLASVLLSRAVEHDPDELAALHMQVRKTALARPKVARALPWFFAQPGRARAAMKASAALWMQR